MAKELGFDGIMHNSMNAVGDRDFVLEALYWGSFLLAITMFVLWFLLTSAKDDPHIEICRGFDHLLQP